MKKRVVENSLLAYYAGQEVFFNDRELKVLQALKYSKDLTDREIMLALGFEDMNAVRPRITELIERGVMAKTGNRRDPITGKTVRMVSLREDPRKPQAEFGFILEAKAC